MKAVATGKLFGGLVDCYVLEDGRRVLSQRGAVAALTQKAGETGGAKHGLLGRFFERLPENYRPESVDPVSGIQLPGGGTANGIGAEWFVDILNAYADADDADALHTQQRHLAKNANRLLRTLAKVGIVALIDEATGYERVRSEGALNSYLFRLLSEEPLEWDEMFRPSLVMAICNVYGKTWEGRRHPQWMASVNAKMYEMIVGSEALKRLRSIDPALRAGSNHHQHFTHEARAEFRRALELVEVIAGQCNGTPADFWMRLEHQFYGTGLQLSWPGGKAA